MAFCGQSSHPHRPDRNLIHLIDRWTYQFGRSVPIVAHSETTARNVDPSESPPASPSQAPLPPCNRQFSRREPHPRRKPTRLAILTSSNTFSETTQRTPKAPDPSWSLFAPLRLCEPLSPVSHARKHRPNPENTWRDPAPHRRAVCRSAALRLTHFENQPLPVRKNLPAIFPLFPTR